ncbi:MAG: tRNA (adenosine(37)-N6)-threonylcarbamoyltransferase complex transferase subunit TsaD [Nitrospiraceae bacterium]|nr:tRNA (adenosine(37)-N6)-threonylcarbamoyltransferase complex transferase subunit TsaD [Nitrospiraceae bacterium]
MILAVESSCDDTSVALVDMTGALFFHRSLSQNDLHAPYGGVVPELASRTHSERLPYLVETAFSETGLSLDQVSAAALTVGPGLSGGLLAAISFLKGLCWSKNIPMIPVHHIRAHLRVAMDPTLVIPRESLGLVVSGGHTHLYRIREWPDLDLVGQTTDDAAGEAFDKGAKALGLPYPGGPEIEKQGRLWDGPLLKFVRGIHTKNPFDFSFSGLKTAFVGQVRQAGGDPSRVPQFAASYQSAIVAHLVSRIEKALETFRPPALLVGGGVAANDHFRKALEILCDEGGIPLHIAPRPLCGDNAVMVALTGLELFRTGCRVNSPYAEIRPRPRWDED